MIIQNNYENVLENEKLTQMKYKTIFSKTAKKRIKKGKKIEYIFLTQIRFGECN
jgi:hypothetical protein